MAANKFFTWTKGDRKHASSSFVPIPAECITIKGLEYSRNANGSSKTRKPLPLDFGQPSTTRLSQSSRAHDSIALQDAAVQSATSLMAVMSDMLKSPQLSAHLLSTQQNSAGLLPLQQGRPRSRTAPSTPMFEAPNMEPAELPGSTPSWHQSHSKATEISASRAITIPDHATFGRNIERPHSSPQEPTYKTPIYPMQSSDNFSRSVTSLHTPEATPHKNRSSSHLSPRVLPLRTTVDTSESTRGGETSDSGRPSLEVHPGRHRKSSSVSGSLAESRNGSSQNMFQDVKPLRYANLPNESENVLANTTAMLEQITAMRTAHEAHLSSLKESHERELDSHRAYISLLEGRQSMGRVGDENIESGLSLDTSHAQAQRTRFSNDQSSATTSVNSFEASLESQKRKSAEALAELEALKRKLSLSLKAQAQLGGVRRERDQLKEATERSDKRIVQLKDIIRKAKEGEKASKATIGTLEAALESANMARNDALEGFYEACEQVKRLTAWQKAMAKERNELRRQFHDATAHREASGAKHMASPEPERKPEFPAFDHKRATLRDDPLIQQLDGMRLLLAEKDSRIRELEESVTKSHKDEPPYTNGTSPVVAAENRNLIEQLQNCKIQLEKARNDRDRFDELLHSEIRRQTKNNVQKVHSVTPQIQQEAMASFADRLQRSAIATNMPADAPRVALIEQELKHCIQEIIMYKLDVKGYKKDLRAANAKVEAYEAAANRPETPDSRTGRVAHIPQASRAEHGVVASAPTEPSSAGLGILMQRQSTPVSTIAKATTNSLSSCAPTPDVVNTSSNSPFRCNTPLGVHKKLPKPPPQTPSPRPPNSPPTTNLSKVQRQETLRSLSESIISSYAKRGTPDLKSDTTPPLSTAPKRGRNSDPPRKSEDYLQPFGGGLNTVAVAMPIAKYSSEMLRTPQQQQQQRYKTGIRDEVMSARKI